MQLASYNAEWYTVSVNIHIKIKIVLKWPNQAWIVYIFHLFYFIAPSVASSWFSSIQHFCFLVFSGDVTLVSKSSKHAWTLVKRAPCINKVLAGCSFNCITRRAAPPVQTAHTHPVSCRAPRHQLRLDRRDTLQLQSCCSSGSRQNQLRWWRADRRHTKEALL